MSRRQPPSKKRGPKVPVIFYLFWPLWGPIVLKVKAAKKAKKKAETITKDDLATMAKAVKSGKLDELEQVARHIQRKSFRYRNRQVVDAAYVAFALAVSKLLILGPSLLPLIGLLVFGWLLVKTPAWLLKVSRQPLPELKTALLDRIPKKWPLKVRTVAARFCSPFTGACFVALLGAWWWGASLGRVAGFWTWFVVMAVTLAVRAWRFQVRAFEVTVPTTGTPEGDWAEFIAEKHGEAKGSRLLGIEDFNNAEGRRLGWSGGVELPKGSDGASAVTDALRGPVSTTFGVGIEDVMFERKEKPEGGFDERFFVVTVLDEPGSNAVLQTHEYDGSDFGDIAPGVWTQAIRADWKPALGQLYSEQVGGFSTHISGETGGGKSEGIETVLRSITARGVVAPWIIDLGGASFVDWKDKVEIFVDNPTDAIQLLANHGELIQLRNRKLGKLRQIIDGEDVGPRRVYPIDREHPCIPGVFDEWEFALADPEIGKVVLSYSEGVLTQQRKVVVPLIVAGQSTGLKAGFKNSQRARTQFQAGNMIAYKNNSESGGQVFGKQIRVNPSMLPLEHKGSCFMTSNADARDAMARSRWVRRPKLWDAQIDIPQMPCDEIDVLTKGLSTRPKLVQVPANMPTPRKAPTEGAEVVEPAALHVVKSETPKLSPLAAEVVDWVVQQEKPVQRQEVVAEFARRMRASSRAIDNALKEAKEAEALASLKPGFYTSAKEGVA